jgi:hypothetical protein
MICCLSLGCGGDKTYRVSGAVTFNGNPVPAGKIYFMPDGSKGNTGAAGYADIKDGQYDTSATGGRGTAGGPMIVRIEGSDPSAAVQKAKGDTSGEEVAKVLFVPYQTSADLPTADTKKDFDVPTEAGKKKPQVGEAVDTGP